MGSTILRGSPPVGQALGIEFDIGFQITLDFIQVGAIGKLRHYTTSQCLLHSLLASGIVGLYLATDFDIVVNPVIETG